MKIPCLLLFLCFVLFSCSPKEEENRILGHHLDDFQTCMEDPDESFDNIRDLSLGYSLSFPEYWEHETRSDTLAESITAHRYITDTTDYSILDSHIMNVTYFLEKSGEMEKFVNDFSTASTNMGLKLLNSGKGTAFGKECQWLVMEDKREDYSNKMFLLFFPSPDKEHVILYEYSAYAGEDWYQNLCDMLRFKQDV